MSELEKQIIIAFAECDMNISELARKLMYHRNTINWRLDRIYEKTNLNPRKFYDLIKLLKEVQSNEN